jgi:8-oxo-dGTP pyrophosphatase MutT (NUDIX family)
MFKPHVTVACVVHAQGKFLVVEETINGKALWNQPAGHLEADETLVEAARRELWEETGIHADPQHFIRLHQWIAPIAHHSCASYLPLSLAKRAPLNRTMTISIAACGSQPTRS